MKEELYNKFKNLITEACEAHLAAGGTIISGSFTRDDSCCPISCVVGAPSLLSYGPFHELNVRLGEQVPEEEYWNFIDGFDGKDATSVRESTKLFQLGRELRAKYIKES